MTPACDYERTVHLHAVESERERECECECVEIECCGIESGMIYYLSAELPVPGPVPVNSTFDALGRLTVEEA